MISKIGKLNSVEVKKSIRDSVLVALAVLLSRVLQDLGAVDFGTHQALADLFISSAIFLVNRWTNFLRINNSGDIKTILND